MKKLSLPLSIIILLLCMGIGGVAVGFSFGSGIGSYLIPVQSTKPADSLETDTKLQPQVAQNIISQTEYPAQVAVSFEDEEGAIGQAVLAQISLNTGETEVNGFDIILHYDPQEFISNQTTVAISPELEENFATIAVNKIDQEKGEITLSALTDLDNSFKGELNLGSILLSPQQSGTLKVDVVFDGPGQATVNTQVHGSSSKVNLVGKVVEATLTVN
ncbi:hypothetical protein GYA49_04390 [Candidatus Beckwithbacteria bacterium]|nr:hypothetical protein [Candidatus Beckwithbacteria bacterium]